MREKSQRLLTSLHEVTARLRRFASTRLAAVALLLAIVAGIAGTMALAATNTASVETESGSLASCASTVSDSSASGGAAISFSDCGSNNPLSPFNLDDTGATVPDTDYAIPSGAIFMAITGNDSNTGTESAPVKTLNQAISLAPSGGTIVIRGGVYRDSYHKSGQPYYYQILTKQLTFQVYPHEQVWFDGTEVQDTSSWTSDGAGHWYKSWNTPQFCDGAYYDFPYNNQSQTGNLTGASGKTYTSNTGPCSHWDVYGNAEANYPAAGDPQMVFIDGQQMPEVDQLSLATGGKFYYDWTNKKIYISTNPSGHTVELAVRPNALVTGAVGTEIKGIGFRRFATNEYSNLTSGAVYMGGSNFVVENCMFTQNAASSLYMDPQGSTLDHVAEVNNGFSSTGGNGHSQGGDPDNVVVENSLLANNNTEHFDLNCSLSCGQAGMKMAHMKGFTFKNNLVENNQGAGFWCDENCTGGVIVDNLFLNNTNAGIFYEVSSQGIIASNVVANTTTTGTASGIQVASATTKVYNNTIITNHANESIWVYDDARDACDLRNTQIGPDTTGVSIVNNVIYNTNKTVASIDADGQATGCGSTQPDQFFDTIDYNAYYRQNGTNVYSLVRWNPYGGPDLKWNTLADFTAAKGYGAHGIDITTGGDPFFVDLANGNYNIRNNSQAYQSGTSLPSDVANAIGVTTAANQNRGALIWPGSD